MDCFLKRFNLSFLQSHNFNNFPQLLSAMAMLSEGRIMRSSVRKIRRPLPEPESISVENEDKGGGRMSRVFRRSSLREMPLEERREEAKKPLYLTRYE